ncbi:LysR family transcriptional regulator [Rhodanobacter terrae]|uniref:LysR family transcriptional regulator n=1 Tax=Rhodanobacter terrae TaxID=418647 RepID=A0ABW0SWB0_9GAMM
MNFRHLRFFIVVAEELHFARAAERLHVEQSPLSRAIKALECDLGVQLFERTTRNTRLTWAGQVFLDEARRILAGVEQAKASVIAAATGSQGRLRLALSDGIAPLRLAAVLAQCREEEPEVEIRVFEMPFAQQIRGLRSDLLDVGLALAGDVGDGIVATPVWADPMAVVVPARHPLLVHKRIPLGEALKYPLILCHPEAGSGCYSQIVAILRTVEAEPTVIEHATSLEILLTLVGAGYGVGFAIASQIASIQRADVIARPLAGRSPLLKTFLLRDNHEPPDVVKRFIERLLSAEGALLCNGGGPVCPSEVDAR